MKIAFSIVLALVSSVLAAQEFRSQAAKSAKTKYEAAAQQARDQYVEDLRLAAKQALENGQDSEVEKITAEVLLIESQETSRAGDPIVQARLELEGTAWTWTSRTNRLKFLEDGKVETSTGQQGVWQMLEPQTAIVKFQDLFVLSFSEDFKNYRAYPYAETTSKLKGGRRVGR